MREKEDERLNIYQAIYGKTKINGEVQIGKKEVEPIGNYFSKIFLGNFGKPFLKLSVKVQF